MSGLRESWVCIGVAAAVLGCSAAQVCAEGKLADFAADVEAGSHEARRSTSSSDSEGSCVGEFFRGIFSDLFREALVYGGGCSLTRVSGGDADEDIPPRELGDGLIPFARTDVTYQFVESDVEAVDTRVELGFGPIGVHGNLTRYREQEPRDNLSILRVFGAYRMSFGQHVETDLGVGALTVMGDAAPSRFLMTIPVLWHPSEHWGVEFRPAWAECVRDYDLAALISLKGVSLKLGYRWIDSPAESLDGPYVGVSIRL